MSDIATDLRTVTAGMAVGHYANDDDNFGEAVGELVDMGHDRETASDALAAWIDETPTWDCAECGTENIEVAGWAHCPSCDALNPEVTFTTVEG